MKNYPSTTLNLKKMKSRIINQIVICTSLKSDHSYHYFIDADGVMEYHRLCPHWAVHIQGYEIDDIVLYANVVTDAVIDFAKIYADSFNAVLVLPELTTKNKKVKNESPTNSIDTDVK